jgi:hypothetical protein
MASTSSASGPTISSVRDEPATRTGLGPALLVVLRPEDVGGWLRLAGLATMAVCGGLLTAAGSAARRRAA